MFAVVARVTAKPGMGNQLYPLLRDLVEPTRGETGCKRYDLHRKLDNEDEFLFYEIWESEPDLQAHLKSPHFVAIYGKAAELLAAPAEISSYTAPE